MPRILPAISIQAASSNANNTFSKGRESTAATETRRPTATQYLRLDASKTSNSRLQRGRELTVRTVSLLAPILFNSTVGVGVAWVSALCLNLGNPFSHTPPKEQSHRTFLVATLLWVHVFVCGMVWLARSVSLFHLRVLSRPQYRAGARVMLLKMLRRTIVWFVFAGTAVAAVGYGCGNLDATWSKYRPEIYASAFWYHSFQPAVERAARRIYRKETVEGHDQQQKQLQNEELRNTPSRTRHSHRSWHRRLFYTGIVFAMSSTPVLYVHVISLLSVKGSTRYVVILTIASLALKSVTQEVSKFYILRTKIRSIRAMSLLVGMPTGLIDTQVRVAILRMQNMQLTVSTTLALAAFEITTRVAKAKWRKRKLEQRVATVNIIPKLPSSLPPPENLEEWRTQVLKYHATELSANMYAEYLAIGCSSVITIVFGDHPQFLLRSDTLTALGRCAWLRLFLARSRSNWLWISCRAWWSWRVD